MMTAIQEIDFTNTIVQNHLNLNIQTLIEQNPLSHFKIRNTMEDSTA